MAHLTHASEMEKKIETLSRITSILKDVIQNKVICKRGAANFCPTCIAYIVYALKWSSKI